MAANYTYNLWTKEEEEILINYYPKIGGAVMGLLPNRDIPMIYQKASRMNLKKPGFIPHGFKGKDSQECCHCRKIFSFNRFNKDRTKKNGYDSQCKKCNSKERKEQYQLEKDSIIDPIDYWAFRCKHRYGTDEEELKGILFSQKKLCCICKSNLIFNKGLGWERGALDHCHTTKVIRGILCSRCNRVLGMVEENTEILIKMIEYLTKEEYTNLFVIKEPK